MTRLMIPVPLRWADLDAYGHVNNVAVMRLLEEARIAAFWRHPDAVDVDGPAAAVLDAGPGSTTHTLVARHEVEYLLPLAYQRDPVTVEMWVSNLGGASMEVCYQLTATRAGERSVYVQATTTLVLIDAGTGRPRRITAAERSVWAAHLDAPLVLRRRGTSAERSRSVGS